MEFQFYFCVFGLSLDEAQFLLSDLLTAGAITKQGPVSQVLKCWKISTCQGKLETGIPVCLPHSVKTESSLVCFCLLGKTYEEWGEDLKAPPWIRFFLPLFLDYTCSDLREETDCSGLK